MVRQAFSCLILQLEDGLAEQTFVRTKSHRSVESKTLVATLATTILHVCKGADSGGAVRTTRQRISDKSGPASTAESLLISAEGTIADMANCREKQLEEALDYFACQRHG